MVQTLMPTGGISVAILIGLLELAGGFPSDEEKITRIANKYEELLTGSFAPRCRDDLQNIKSMIDVIKSHPHRFKNNPIIQSAQNGLEHSPLNVELLQAAGFTIDDQAAITLRSSESLNMVSACIDHLLASPDEPPASRSEASKASSASRKPKDESLKRLLLHTIRFTQDSVGSHFRDGNSLDFVTKELSLGRMSTDDLPAIRVVEQMEMYWSLDNRRLKCMKEAFPQCDYPDKTVLVKMKSLTDPALKNEWMEKFSTGTDVRTRAGNGNAKGNTKGNTKGNAKGNVKGKGRGMGGRHSAV